jgi:hypothetical protein
MCGDGDVEEYREYTYFKSETLFTGKYNAEFLINIPSASFHPGVWKNAIKIQLLFFFLLL